ncbi:MAG: flagellar hook-associated protein FlgK [Candidatus Puniceispirillaceae bacterium]
MTSLFDVGKSALNSYRQSLAVTGQNIANINTEGYKRREASLEEVAGSQGGVTSLANQTGLGVRVSDIRRSFDQYLLDRTRSATAQFEKLNAYVDETRQLENMLLPNEGDLGAQIANFFDSLREVAADPADIAPRAVAIETGKSLAAGFNNYAMQIDQMKSHIRNSLTDQVNALNLLADALADINGRISASGQSGSSPNSILDLRDQTLGEISKLTDITVNYSGRGVAQVKLGASGVGPLLVDANQSFAIDVVDVNGGLQPTIMSAGQQVATNQISAGIISGQIDAFGLADSTLEDINHLAQMMSNEMNAQHRQGRTLEGVSGQNMFSVADLTLSTGIANRSAVSGNATVLDPEALPMSKMTATYNGEDERWVLTGEALEQPVFGVRRLEAPGFFIQINGEPRSGDTLHLDPFAGAAAGFRFLLDKPQMIAASSGLLVSSDPDNLSETEMDVTTVTPASEVPLKSVSDVFKNSASPIEASEFIRDGFVAEIPAGSNGMSLTSLTKQAEAKFYLSSVEIGKVSQLSFALTDTTPAGPFSFDVRYQTAFPNQPSTSNWSDLAELAEMLNQGVLTDSAGQTLKQRGLHASASGGTLTLASSRGNFDDSEANIASLAVGGGIIRGVLSEAISASDIQIFTKEGLHIAGNVLSNDEISNIMRSEHGFVPEAGYNASYLNLDDPAYRGMDIEISRSEGTQSILMGANGIGASAFGGKGRMPVSDAPAQMLNFAVGDGLSGIVNLEKSSSASDAADVINKSLKNMGIEATARLRVELSDLSANGNVSFMLEANNATPIKISAEVNSGDLSNLATAINDQSARLGITAQLSTNRKRVILESDSGRDIFLSDYSAQSPTIESRVIHDDGSAATNSVRLGSTDNASDNARYSGVVTLDSVKAFTITRPDGAVTSSAADVTKGGLVSISSNASSDSKLIRFDVNADADTADASNDGQKAVAAGGSYQINLPTSNSNISFTASVTTAELGEVSTAEINRKMIEKLRAEGPLSSLSGGDLAAKPGSQTFRYTGTGNIDAASTFSLVVEETTFNVPMTGITDSRAMMQAAVTQINNAELGVTASLSTSRATSDGLGIETPTAIAAKANSTDIEITTNTASGTAVTIIEETQLLPAGTTLSSLGFDAETDFVRTSPVAGTAVIDNGDGTFDLRLTTDHSEPNLSVNPSQTVTIEARDTSLPSVVAGTASSAAAVTATTTTTIVSGQSGVTDFVISEAEVTDNSASTAIISATGVRTVVISGNPAGVSFADNGNFEFDITIDRDNAGNVAAGTYPITIEYQNNGSTVFTETINLTVSDYIQHTFTTNLSVLDGTEAGGVHDLKIEANELGQSFSMGAVNFTDPSESDAAVSYISSVTAKKMPEDGTAVYVDYGTDSYKLEMVDGEVVVSGGEAGRLVAYFDADKRLQVFGNGSLSGQPIKVSSNEKYAQNDTNAAAFGLTANMMRFAGQLVTPNVNMTPLRFSFNDTDIQASFNASGNLVTTPMPLPAGLNIQFQQEAGATDGRVIITYDSDEHTVEFDMPQDALGIKVADFNLNLEQEGIRVTSRSGDVVNVTATAVSLAKQNISFSDLVVEDLLVFVTGSGARNMNAQYQDITTADQDMLAARLAEKGLVVTSVSDDGLHFDVLDGETGHVIASRTLSENKDMQFANYKFTMKGDAQKNDRFILEQIAGVAGDARNLDLMIRKQSEDLNGVGSGGFSDMFSILVAGVGASVSASTLSRDGAEATKEAATEAESAFSGVNLDSEAAALIEFQQAYQASARILTTARELFQTLIDVV